MFLLLNLYHVISTCIYSTYVCLSTITYCVLATFWQLTFIRFLIPVLSVWTLIYCCPPVSSFLFFLLHVKYYLSMSCLTYCKLGFPNLYILSLDFFIASTCVQYSVKCTPPETPHITHFIFGTSSFLILSVHFVFNVSRYCYILKLLSHFLSLALNVQTLQPYWPILCMKLLKNFFPVWRLNLLVGSIMHFLVNAVLTH